MRFNNDPEFLKQRADAYRQRKDDPSGGSKDFIFSQRVQLFSPRDGENIIRLLPAGWEKALFPWYDNAYIHYQIGSSQSQFLCAYKMFNKPCPICEEGKREADSGATQEALKPFFAQRRAVAWIIDRLESDKGPQIWVMPHKNIAQQIIKISFKRSGEPVFVDSIDEGWDILFTKEGKGITTKYSGLRKDDEPSILNPNDEVAGRWLRHVEEMNIPSLLNFKSYAHIKSVLLGTPDEEDSEKPIESTSTKKVKVEKDKPATHSNGNGLLSQLQNMSRAELEDYVESRDDLDINPEDWGSTESLVEAIALELNLQ